MSDVEFIANQMFNRGFDAAAAGFLERVSFGEISDNRIAYLVKLWGSFK